MAFQSADRVTVGVAYSQTNPGASGFQRYLDARRQAGGASIPAVGSETSKYQIYVLQGLLRRALELTSSVPKGQAKPVTFYGIFCFLWARVADGSGTSTAIIPLKPTDGLTPISCHAVLERSAYAPFIKEKVHGVYQRHKPPQEIGANGAPSICCRCGKNYAAPVGLNSEPASSHADFLAPEVLLCCPVQSGGHSGFGKKNTNRVPEKTRARLSQSSRFHDLCRFISWES